MASSQLRRRIHSISKALPPFLSQIANTPPSVSLSTTADSTHLSNSSPEPTSLSARMSFLFQQIDEIDKQRQEKDQTLERIRDWRESKKQQNAPTHTSDSPGSDSVKDLNLELLKSEVLMSIDEKNEVELVHPWPEWIELMERLVQQNYFDLRRKDEEGMMQSLGFDMSEVDVQEKGKVRDFTRDFDSVRTAAINFGKDRFDILRSLPRQDLQILVGYGCPSTDKRVVFSSKLLRKHVHLDEGDVCSSCSMRSSCEKAYLLTNKEDEARTIDVMRILLTYGFDPTDGSVVNKSLVKMKSMKTSVRRLLHHVVKLSAVPIDPNLPPPIIKKPTPKVKQPPPPPKKKVGRYDIEMKKGDWLCSKCDFMNFAKNTVCLQCDAKRPKRQLLPGEWECPQCNFLNYRRNTVCFQCEHNRPPDTYGESRIPERQQGLGVKMDKRSSRTEVSNAWNFDFDDDESDGADVATFENADSQKVDRDIPLNTRNTSENYRTRGDGLERSSRPPKLFEKEYSDSSTMRPGLGFNDFDEDDDDDDVDSYDVVNQNEVPETSRVDFSELEPESESEDMGSLDDNWHTRSKTRSLTRGKKPLRHKAHLSDSEEGGVDFGSDDELPMHPNWRSSHVANPKTRNGSRKDIGFGSDDDLDSSYASDDETLRSKKEGNQRWGSYKPNKAKREKYKAKSFSDDEFSHEAGRDRTRKAHRGRGGMERGSFNNSFSSPSGSLRNNRGIRDKSYNEQPRHAKDGKFRSRSNGGSFEKRGGISNSYDSRSDTYLEDERPRRPRMNVR